MKRIGLIIPNTDTTLEKDLQRNLSEMVSCHTERVWLDSVTVEAEEKMLQEEVPRAARYLAPIQPNVVVFGCTSAGAIRGPDGEQKFCNWLGTIVRCRVVSAFGSVCRQLGRCVDDARIWLVSPYGRDVHDTMSSALKLCGLDIHDGGHMGLKNDVDIGCVQPGDILRFVMDLDIPSSREDCIFISCTNLRSAEIADELAAEMCCSVVTSNTAILQELKTIHSVY